MGSGFRVLSYRFWALGLRIRVQGWVFGVDGLRFGT